MAGHDQFLIEAASSYSGSYTDDLIIGDIFRHDTTLSGAFNREVVGNSVKRGVFEQKFSRKNIPYNERIRIISGSVIPGRSNVRFAKASSINETYFDSFVPSPVDITKTNGVIFPFVGDSSSLDGSPVHNIPGLGTNAASIFLSNVSNFNITQTSPILNEIVDADWNRAKWPFRGKYQNLDRIFNPSTKLPSPVEQTKDMQGNTVTPPSKSSNLGSVYYVADEYLELHHPQFSTGISSSTGFLLKDLPVPPTGAEGITVEYIDFVSSPEAVTNDKTHIYLAVGGVDDDIPLLYKSSDGEGLFWENITPKNADPVKYFSVTYGVDNAFPDPWSTWVMVGGNGTNGPSILVNTTDRNPSADNWVNKSPGSSTGDTLLGVAFNDPIGGQANANFAAVGTVGMIITSSNRLGDSWDEVGSTVKPNFKDLHDVTFTENGNRFIAVGDETIWTSDDRFGTSWTERAAPANISFLRVGSRKSDPVGGSAVNIIVAVGFNTSTNSGVIYRSTDNGLNWTDVTPGDFPSYIGLNGISPGRPGDDIDWITGGFLTALPPNLEEDLKNVILISRDDGLTWVSGSQAEIDFDPLRGQVFAISAVSVDSEANLLVGGRRYIMAGASNVSINNVVFRPTNIVSNAVTASNGELINEVALLRRNGVKPGKNIDIRTTPTRFDEYYRAYFGFGDGASVDLAKFGPSSSAPPNHTYLRKKSTGFFDYTIYNASNVLAAESLRTHGVRIRGWGYGMLSGIPTKSTVIWRSDRFGQFRDILEQRPFSKMFVPPTELGADIGSSQGAVRVFFVSGSNADITASNPLTLNPRDSGIYDTEYRSGQPFSDSG